MALDFKSSGVDMQIYITQVCTTHIHSQTAEATKRRKTNRSYHVKGRAKVEVIQNLKSLNRRYPHLEKVLKKTSELFWVKI